MDSNRTHIDIERPLIVDMDGTLLKTDMLYESANNFIIQRLFSVFYLLYWLFKGKGHLKAQLAKTSQVDATVLPYNSNLITFLEQQKATGRTIILATASHRLLADSIAQHLGLFDEVMATEGAINLKSHSKRDLLVERFGKKGFDYIGNDHADLPVWENSHKAYIVSNSPSLIKKVRNSHSDVEVIVSEKPSILYITVKTLRVHQWVKNLLIFVPSLAAHQFNVEHITELFIAFTVFCLTASSVYVLNDLIDVTHDRYHHRKRKRPFAAGNLSLLTGWMLWPTLLIIAAVIAALKLPMFFCVILAAYFIVTVAYSLRLKQVAIVDVITLAVLYTLRIIAGAVAISIPLSFWLLSLSIFIFLSLAFIKRYSELYLSRQAGRHVQVKGRGYVHEDLEIISSMGIGAGYLAVLVLALYVQDPHTTELYHHPKFIWLACPLLLYWISRAWLITARGRMHDDPIIFAIKDTISWLVAACFMGVFTLAMVN